jgi:hypothetical protein
MRHLFVLPILVLSLLSSNPAVVTAQSSDEAALRRFIERFLRLNDNKSQLLIGELPKDLSIALPIPDKAEVLGSVVHSGGNYQILLDTVQSPKQVQDFYRDRLKAEGWTPREETSGLGGFDSSPFEFPDTYCKSSTGPALFLTIGSEGNPFTPVNLTLNDNQGREICRQQAVERGFPRSPLPTLETPEDTEVISSGSGGGGDQFYSSAGITTKLSSQALFANYAAQLKEAGWTQQANGQEDRLNWSIWRFQDQQKQPWQAIMTFTQVEGKSGEYIGRITAFQDGVRD